ncbi:hypothetical protein MF672_015165 [Actinomadura sp. ATCC 31491]|uniref:DUF3558 domain-containing protein n=1 Tax=Actinomadura luzonensis TaxID=2805427 RepID=A0ABT0FSH7_9ACTN|nr:hypothetical protein [Actinomadura luzonensis]MCK2215118.1 hypothetical protein [Actinomadura luzonensis]
MGFPEQPENAQERGPRRSRRARPADEPRTEGPASPGAPGTPGTAPYGSFGAFTPPGPGGPGPGGPGTGGPGPGSFGPGGAGPGGPGTGGFGAVGPGPAESAPAPEEGSGGGSSSGTTQVNSRIGWSPYDEGPRSRAPLWFAIGGVLLLGALGGGIALMWNADGPSTAETATTQRTSAPLPSVPPGKYGYAENRSTDPDPISVKEMFGKKGKFTAAGRGYETTITIKDKKCTDGALGDKLQKALKAAKCTQLVRASFRDKAGTVIGTVGVANLSTGKNAGKVAKVGDEQNYVKPLVGKDSVTKFLGSGSGGARIWTHGHYAIMVWFQNKNGTKPDSKGQKRISQAIDDITRATVFKALDNRTLNGSAPA